MEEHAELKINNYNYLQQQEQISQNNFEWKKPDFKVYIFYMSLYFCKVERWAHIVYGIAGRRTVSLSRREEVTTGCGYIANKIKKSLCPWSLSLSWGWQAICNQKNKIHAAS